MAGAADDSAYAAALNAIVAASRSEPYPVIAERYLALIAQQPQRVEAYQSLALYACLCGQLPAAQLVIDEALQMPVGQARSHYIKGRICDEALAFEASARHYAQSLQLDPGNEKCRFNLGLAQLTLGDFEAGSRHYEARLSPAERAVADAKPAWQPGSPAGRVLIWAEQGLGDELMFARLLPALRSQAARFTLQCDARLQPLLQLNHPWLDFVPRGDLRPLLPAFDAQLPLGGLMRLFHDRLAQPALRDAHLQPVPRPEVDALLQAAARPGRSWVGLSWLSMNAEYGRQRSLPLDALLAAFDPQRHGLVNLQYLAPPEQLAAMRARGFEVVDGVDAYQDISGLAALMAGCRHIVTIDNSTLHLAGALGLPTLALIPQLPNWRWQREGTGTVWYPGVELLRQRVAGDWAAELETVRQRVA